MSHNIPTGNIDGSLYTDMDTYGIFYPSDGYVDLGHGDADTAREYIEYVQSANKVLGIDTADGAYVIRVQIERVEES